MTDKIVVVKPVPVDFLELLKAKMKPHVRRIIGNKSCAKRWQRPFAWSVSEFMCCVMILVSSVLKVCFAFVYHKSEIMVEMWFLFVVDLSG